MEFLRQATKGEGAGILFVTGLANVDDSPTQPMSSEDSNKPQPLHLQEFEDEVMPKRLHWQEILEILRRGGFPCLDGRNENPEGIEGVAGGDAGICLAIAGALEKLLDRELTQDELNEIVENVPGTAYMHTAGHVLYGHEGKEDGLIHRVLRDPILQKYAKTPDDVLRLFDEGTGDPEADARLMEFEEEAMGCGHLDRAKKNFKAYGVREGLSGGIVRGTLVRKWKKRSDHPTVIEPLPHEHGERALVEIRFTKKKAAALKEPGSLVPVVQANAKDGGQFFVVGAEEVIGMRIEQIVDLIMDQYPDVNRDALVAEARKLLALQTAQTAHGLAKGLPHLVITVDEHDEVVVTEEDPIA